MIQVGILCVLVLIAVLIAPWLMLVGAAGIALYGAALVVAAATFVVVGTIVLAWVIVRGIRRRRGDLPDQIRGARKSCPHCQVEMAATATYCRNCKS